MVDYELFKTILNQKDDGYIENGDFIDNKTLHLFVCSSAKKVPILFKSQGTHVSYTVEVDCEKCGKLFTLKTCKSSFLKILTSYRFSLKNVLCDECKEKALKEKELVYKKKKIDNELTIKENTEEFIKNYLSPDKAWMMHMTVYRKMKLLLYDYVDFTVIHDYIVDMDYHDFLQTPYWKAISEQVKSNAGYRCQLCNSDTNLSVHHRTYEHHGDELHNIGDLICLCQDCHEKHHFD